MEEALEEVRKNNDQAQKVLEEEFHCLSLDEKEYKKELKEC